MHYRASKITMITTLANHLLWGDLKKIDVYEFQSTGNGKAIHGLPYSVHPSGFTIRTAKSCIPAAFPATANT